MHLLGHFSNPSSSLQVVFDNLPDDPIVPTAGEAATLEPVMRRLGNGVVQRSVVKVLVASDVPMRHLPSVSLLRPCLGTWCPRSP